MKNTNLRKKNVNENCEKSNQKNSTHINSQSVSISKSSDWAKLTKRVIRENIGAWKTLSEE